MERIKPTLAGAGMLALSAALMWSFLQLLENGLVNNFVLFMISLFFLAMPAFYFLVRSLVVFLNTSNPQWRMESAETTTNIIEGLGKLSYVILALFIFSIAVFYFWDSLAQIASTADFVIIGLLAIVIFLLLFILDCVLKILALLRSRAS